MILLEPRRLDKRILKLQQQNKKMLMETEVLYNVYLKIDESWNFDLEPKYIKTKKIIGYVWLDLNHIPKWIKDIEITGSFNCLGSDLINLKNCPKIINGSFLCQYNNLTSLEDGPTYVGGDYLCNNNNVKFTKEYVCSICNVNNIIYV